MTTKIRRYYFREQLLKNQKKALSSGLDVSSQPVARSLLSALRRFKTLFGMGRVGATSLKRPELNALFSAQLKIEQYVNVTLIARSMYFELTIELLFMRQREIRTTLRRYTLKSEEKMSWANYTNYVRLTLSTVKLSLLPGLHLLPINVVVYDGSNREI